MDSDWKWTDEQKTTPYFFDMVKEAIGPLFDNEFALRQREIKEKRAENAKKWQSNKKQVFRPGRTAYVPPVVHTIEGTIDPQFVDPNGTRVKIGNHAVANLDVTSSAFTYKVTFNESSRTFRGLTLVHCKSFTATPLPLTASLFKTLLLSCDVSQRTVTNLLAKLHSRESDKEQLHMSIVLERLKEYKRDFPDEIDFNKTVMIRYFLHEKVELLEQLYKKDTQRIYTLLWNDVEEIYETFKQTPSILCCNGMYSFTWQIEDPDTGKVNAEKKYRDLVPVTELTLQDLKDHCVQISPFEEAWIKIYKYLKEEYYGDGNTFVDKYYVEHSLDGIVKQDVVNSAIKFLIEKGVIIRDSHRIYLKRPFLYEQMIAYALGQLRENALATAEASRQMLEYAIEQLRKTVFAKTDVSEHVLLIQAMSDMTWDVMQFTGTHSHDFERLCSEQSVAIKDCHTKPLVVISGGAGSGKTHTLDVAVRTLYQSDDPIGLIVSAFQHKNVGHLARILPHKGIFYTTHQLVASHCNTCTKAKAASAAAAAAMTTTTTTEGAINGDKKRLQKHKTTGIMYRNCTLENQVVLMYDEAGLLPVDIFARHLFSQVLCSPALMRVVLSGDCSQLPSIYPGRLLSDLKIISEKHFNSFVEYKHNHRVKSRLLFDLTEAVKNKRVDDLVFDGVVATRIDCPVTLAELASLVLEKVEERKYTPESSHFITYTNEVKEFLDEVLERHYLKIPFDKPYHPGIFYPGSKMVIKKNDDSEDIHNNEILIIKRIYDFHPITKKQCAVASTSEYMESETKRFIECVNMYKENKTIPIDSELRKLMRKAYVTTNYAFIGDQAPHIIFIGQDGKQFENAQTLYTGWSRPQESLLVIMNEGALYDAIYREIPEKQTSLVYRVEKEFERLDKLREEKRQQKQKQQQEQPKQQSVQNDDTTFHFAIDTKIEPQLSTITKEAENLTKFQPTLSPVVLEHKPSVVTTTTTTTKSTPLKSYTKSVPVKSKIIVDIDDQDFSNPPEMPTISSPLSFKRIRPEDRQPTSEGLNSSDQNKRKHSALEMLKRERAKKMRIESFEAAVSNPISLISLDSQKSDSSNSGHGAFSGSADGEVLTRREIMELFESDDDEKTKMVIN